MKIDLEMCHSAVQLPINYEEKDADKKRQIVESQAW